MPQARYENCSTVY
jgi:multifunctional beta-oxidation protein